MNPLRRRIAASIKSGVALTSLGVWPIGSFSRLSFAQAQSGTTPAATSSSPEQSGRTLLGLGRAEQAVLLPPNQGPIAWAHQALRAGIIAAHQRDGSNKPLLLIEVEDKAPDLFSVANELSTNGYRWVAGPLTRNGVNTYIDSGAAPLKLLALNSPSPDKPIPSSMLIYGLGLEAEAKQIAGLAFDDAVITHPTRRPLKAVCLSGANQSGKRAAGAFVDTWRELGGDVPLPIDTETRSVAEVKNAIEPNQPDALFLALSQEELRTLRSAFPVNTPLYSTSQLSLFGTQNPRPGPELEGVRFVDMPWMGSPDHPATLAYPKAPQRFTAEMQRLYALGIDTFRLIFDVLPFPNRRVLEGTTGRLTVNAGQNRIDRQCIAFVHRQGTSIPL
jgi:uncharacterized protein